MTTTKAQGRKATEQHDIASLAERLGTEVEAAHQLIASGVLEPLTGNESGDQLVFETEDLDALAAAISQQVEDEVREATEGQPEHKRQFAVARAKYLVKMASRESANQFAAARDTEIRLSKIAEHHDVYLDSTGGILAITEKGATPDFQFGVGGEILGGIAKWGSRLLKRPGKTLGLLDKKMLPDLADATAKGPRPPLSAAAVYGRNSAISGGIGAELGGLRAGLDDDPETSVLGGMAKGGAVGAGVGALGTLAGRKSLDELLKRSKKAGMSIPAGAQRLGNQHGPFLPA